MTPIDEELWFDDSEGDEQAEANAAQSMAARVGRILGAKPFPIAAQKLAELTRAPNARIAQAVRILESDPALSARLLRLVNSAGYALRLRCTSVRHAAALVGTRRLHQVATTAAVLDLFDSKSETAIHVLEHAASVGALSRYLAVHVGLPRDEMFTCGFLHDIGKLMLLDTDGEAYGALLDASADAPDECHLIEREQYGYDHAVLGAHVLSAWNIPEPIPKVVAWHHRPAKAYQQGGQIASMVSTLRLADALSHALLKEPTPELIAQIAQSEAADYLEVSEVQLATMWGELQALRQQCQQRSRGAEPQVSLVPRHDAIAVPPPSRPAPTSSGSPRSLPKHFPCIVCHKPSFGNNCPRCAGYVCSVHQIGPRDWCAQCLNEYNDTVAGKPMSGRFRTVAAAGIIATASAAVIGVVVSGTGDAINLALAPLLLTATGVIVSIVSWRWYLRWSFLRARPRHRMPGGEIAPEAAEAPVLPAADALDWANADALRSSLSPIVAASLPPLGDPAIGIAPTVAVDPELVASLSGLTAPRAADAEPRQRLSPGLSAFEMAAAVAPIELSAFELAAAVTPSGPPPAETHGPSLIPIPSIPITGPAPDESTASASLPPDSADLLPTNFPPATIPFQGSLFAESLPPEALQSIPAEPSEPTLSAIVASPVAVESLPVESTAPESATVELRSHVAAAEPPEQTVEPSDDGPRAGIQREFNTAAPRGQGRYCQPQRHLYACDAAPTLAVVHDLSGDLESDSLPLGSAAVA